MVVHAVGKPGKPLLPLGGCLCPPLHSTAPWLSPCTILQGIYPMLPLGLVPWYLWICRVLLPPI